jgi:cysteine desulfurase
MDPIYLDHNASTPLAPEVVAAMEPWLRAATGNPTSGHVYGQRSRDAVERARRELATLLGCHPIEVCFTASGTEANNMVLQGVFRRFGPCHMVTTAVEHPAVLEVCAWLETQGCQVTRLPVDGRCQLDPAALEAALRPETRLLSVMLANNETGTLLPVAELARRARRAGVLVHCDAAQAVGKIPVAVGELGVDFLSVAGHKFNAPKGVGALYIRTGIPLPPLLFGAGHERGLRPGTENVLELVGLGAAARRFVEEGPQILAAARRVRDRLEAELLARVPGLRINGDREQRLPNTASLSFPAAAVDDLLAACPEVAASAGAACHADQTTPSHVLSAMGFSPAEARRTARLSVGLGSTEELMVAAATALAGAWRRVARG